MYLDRNCLAVNMIIFCNVQNVRDIHVLLLPANANHK